MTYSKFIVTAISFFILGFVIGLFLEQQQHQKDLREIRDYAIQAIREVREETIKEMKL